MPVKHVARKYARMSDEVEHLDMELTDNIANIRTAIEGLEAGKAGDEFAPGTIQKSLEASRALFQSLKVELRELERDELAEFEPKARKHQSTLEELGRNLNLAKSQAERKALVASRKEPESGAAAAAAGKDNKNANEIIEMAKQTQAEDSQGMNRMLRMVDDSETIGKETNVKLKAADKILKQIGKKLHTDKCLACLIVVLVLNNP
ncbi:hypothetical protein T484DRAFT_3253697 [Baffinella frigidus]|nr:hypothetical protein T484DRAFT_3253697 [Cryptophyta sp. CCMP2293]